MTSSSQSVSTSFHRWQKLTDAYARHLAALEHGDRTARAEVLRLGRELQQLNAQHQLDNGFSSAARYRPR